MLLNGVLWLSSPSSSQIFTCHHDTVPKHRATVPKHRGREPKGGQIGNKFTEVG
jgi:hypothetical protein